MWRAGRGDVQHALRTAGQRRVDRHLVETAEQKIMVQTLGPILVELGLVPIELELGMLSLHGADPISRSLAGLVG